VTDDARLENMSPVEEVVAVAEETVGSAAGLRLILGPAGGGL